MICGLSRSAAACSAATSSTRQKCVIVLAEGDLGSLEFLFDEGVAVEIIGGLEGQE